MMRKIKVMLVDDNEIDLYLHEKIMSVAEISEDVVPFLSVKEAMDYLRENINTPENLPELILLDIQMPNLSGFDFLNSFDQLPEETKDIITIFMLSSSIDKGDLERARRNKYVSRVLKKPLELRMIRNSVEYMQEQQEVDKT